MLLPICMLKAHAQDKKDDYAAMLDSAISLKYNAFKAGIKKQDNNYYLENLYLLNEQDQPLNYVPSAHKFKFITIYDDRNRKIIAKGIYAWKALTLLKGNSFTVSIIDFYITYKNHNYNYSNGGGSKTVFEYDCDRKEWKFISSKNFGL